MLCERHPKAVKVADDELAHAIKSVMKSLNDFDSLIQTVEKLVNVVRIDVKIDLPAPGFYLVDPPELNITSVSPNDRIAKLSPSPPSS